MFDYPLRRPTIPARVRDQGSLMRQERRKPELPGPYIYVSGGTGDVSPLATWQSPEWKNSFTSLGSDYVGFRHGLDGYPEFIGVLDLTAGAVTGDVAFTLPLAYRAISFAYNFPIWAGGTDWQNGIMQIDGTTGDVYVYWPVQAAPI